MNSTFKTQLTGTALALAAAGLVGCANPGGSGSASTSTASTDLVHCYGVNACNGHNDCKTADNVCAGHATCKGGLLGP